MLRTRPSPTQETLGVSEAEGSLRRAPGSSTPGGNGSVREATNAPMPAHPARTINQIRTLRPLGTCEAYRGLGFDQPNPSPVMSARNDSPKHTNDASANAAHGWSERVPGRSRCASLATTCATTSTASGPKP